MSREERLEKAAGILAHGVLRLLAKEGQLEESADDAMFEAVENEDTELASKGPPSSHRLRCR